MVKFEDAAAKSRLAFEQKQWTSEFALKERELNLKEQDHALSRWRNPLTVAVAVAVAAWVGNVINTTLTSHWQREIEVQKAKDQVNLEQQKSEAARILEMIRTRDQGETRRNLRFLLDAGLVTTEEQKKRLEQYLASAKDDQIPTTLPPVGVRINAESLSPISSSLLETLQREARNFSNFLAGVGLPTPKEVVNVRIRDLDSPSASYHVLTNEIHIDSRVASHPINLRWAIASHVIEKSKPPLAWNSNAKIIGAALEVFLCTAYNMKDAQILGESLPAGFPKINIDNQESYALLSFGSGEQILSRERYRQVYVWAGLFWSVWREFGPALSEARISAAWMASEFPDDRSAQTDIFVRQLLKSFGPTMANRLRAMLDERKIPHPPL